MFLKNYQKKVVDALRQFYQTAKKTKDSFEVARKNLPEDMRHTLNCVEPVFKDLGKNYIDRCQNGLGDWYSRIVLKVPTGGGKTLLAVEAIREYQNFFAQKRTGLVVWIVPTETIYSQTVKRLRDKSHHLRQLLDQASGGRTIILEKGQRLKTQDIEENLVVLFVMIQSISRKNGKEALKVFKDSGGYESFFPPDNRYDLHGKLLQKYPNLDFIAAAAAPNPQILTSLGNAVRVSNAFIIIDEIHKVFSQTARATIDNLNPAMVLGLSATPKAEMNVLVSVTGLELKDEEMVKLDMHILPPAGRQENDWKAMVREIKAHRDQLEKKGKSLKRKTGLYIRPIALLQVEATGKDQRGKGRVHSADVKEYLAKLEVNPDEIAIKTASQNDIEDENLFSSNCPIRYIITKYALREGWDCSFAYILGVIPNVNSDTSITQLVGRILRQPNARKTGVNDLDESYVYYSRGDTRQMLDRISAGFRNEGLEDLITTVKIKGNEQVNPTKVTKIKKKYMQQFNSAFYLPVWLVTNNGTPQRRFSYATDIKANVAISDFIPSDEQIKTIKESLSEENTARKAFAITIDETSYTAYREESTGYNGDGLINLDYLTRRYCEIIENPFLARKSAGKHIKKTIKIIGRDDTKNHFSFVSSLLYNYLAEEKRKQEESLFLKMLDNGELVLAVSDDEGLGYKIPDRDSITLSNIPATWNFYLFEDVELTSMNTLERKVGDILDRQSTILWWFRNKVSRKWYAIQGWHQNKIRPDFVAAKKNGNGKLDLVYIIESKGEHLSGNTDTQYKKKVLDLMTEQNQNNNIQRYQAQQLNLYEINEKVECYQVEEKKEEELLRNLFS